MGDRQMQGRKKRPAIEWVTGIASAALIVGLIGFLAVQIVLGDDRPPDLTARIERVEPARQGTSLTILVENHGDRAASQVGVRLDFQLDGQPATGDLLFDYVAPHAVRRGTIVAGLTAGDAAAAGVAIIGFVEP